MKVKLGPAGAITATARQIAIMQVEYDETIWAKRDATRETRFETKLRQQAAKRGYKLIPEGNLYNHCAHNTLAVVPQKEKCQEKNLASN